MIKWIGGDVQIVNQSQTKKWYLFYPTNRFLMIWNQIIFLVFLYTIFFVPIQLAFFDQESSSLSIVDQIVNICFLIDILVTLFSVIDINGKEMDSFKVISLYYVKGWFFVDVLTILPWDIFLKSGNFSLVAKLPRVLKFIRITRIFKLNQKMSQNDQSIKLKNLFGIDKQTNDFIIFFIMIIILTHIVSCLWVFLGLIQSGPNWIDSYFMSHQPSDFELYVTSFYWAFTTIDTVGFGDVAAISVAEKIFNIIWICVGVAFYSYCISTLTNILTKNNIKQSAISAQFSFISDFTKQRKLP